MASCGLGGSIPDVEKWGGFCLGLTRWMPRLRPISWENAWNAGQPDAKPTARCYNTNHHFHVFLARQMTSETKKPTIPKAEAMRLNSAGPAGRGGIFSCCFRIGIGGV